LRTNLQFVDIEHHLSSVVVTSAVIGEGKSTTACNLALALAEAGSRVVLVEGDLRRPRVDEYLGLERAVGLTNVLLGEVALEDALQPFGANRLQVLPSGPLPPNPSELLGSSAMQSLLDRLEQVADLVVIDAPPLLPVADASVLGALASGVLLVVDASKTRRDAVRHAADQVRSVGGTLLGAVLTQLPIKGPEAYGYGRKYGYAASAAEVPKTVEAVLPPAGPAQRSEGLSMDRNEVPAVGD
jgi:non-specific protein-tyrosine kinase